MYYIHIGLTPKYLSDCVHTVSAASGRYRLRSTGSEAYILPRTRTRFGERGFFYYGPAAWNTLPSDLHDITDTSTFRKRLKNVLFDRAFNWFCRRSWTCRIAAPYKFCVDWLIDWLTYWRRRRLKLKHFRQLKVRRFHQSHFVWKFNPAVDYGYQPTQQWPAFMPVSNEIRLQFRLKLIEAVTATKI